MIICTECGASNADDDQFCGTCGEFLRWDADAGTGPTRRPDPDAGTRTTQRPDPDAPPRPDRATGDPPRTNQSTDDRPRTERATDEPPRPDRATDEPPRPERTAGDQPGPLQPGLPDRRGQQPDPVPEPVPPVDPPPRPPDPKLTCPACGADNAPGRRFCRSCGGDLAAPAGPAPRRTWWQRLWDRLRRRTPRRSLRDERRAAGAARAARRTLLIVLALCLAGVLAVVGPPLVRRAVEEVRDRTQDPAPLVPNAVTASSEAPGAGAPRLTDGANNRYWAPDGPAVDAWVEGRFTEPVRLLTVVITPGVSPRRQAFLAAGRPRKLTVVTVDADGKEHRTDIELRDEPGAQHFDVEASKVVRIRLVVRSTYGPGLVPSVAIGEAEFFGRR